MDTFSIPPRAGPAETISVTDTTKNMGSVAGGRVADRVLLLGQRDPRRRGSPCSAAAPWPRIPAGGSNAGGTSVQIPAETATGTYFLFAKADANEQVVETSETNNASFATAIKIGPDLTMSA